jgi:hypothetical protein
MPGKRESGSDQNKTLSNLKIGFIKGRKRGLRLIFPIPFLALNKAKAAVPFFRCCGCGQAIEYGHIAFKIGSWKKQNMQTAIRVVALAAAISMIQGLSAPVANFSRDPFH